MIDASLVEFRLAKILSFFIKSVAESVAGSKLGKLNCVLNFMVLRLALLVALLSNILLFSYLTIFGIFWLGLWINDDWWRGLN